MTIVRQQAQLELGQERYISAFQRCEQVVTWLNNNKKWFHDGTVYSGEYGASAMIDSMLALIVYHKDIDEGLNEYIRSVSRRYQKNNRHVKALTFSEKPEEVQIKWTSIGDWYYNNIVSLQKQEAFPSGPPSFTKRDYDRPRFTIDDAAQLALDDLKAQLDAGAIDSATFKRERQKIYYRKYWYKSGRDVRAATKAQAAATL